MIKRPMLANWISFKKQDDDTYLVKNYLCDIEFTLSAYTVWFAKQLDGKRDPYKIDKSLARAEVTSILLDLEECNVIRDRKYLEKGFLYAHRTLWIPRVTFNSRVISCCLNAFLFFTWLPLLAFSIFFLFTNIERVNFDNILIGTLLGLIAGIVMHELGHMVACLGLGGQVFEAGLTFHAFSPGAYVLINNQNIKSRLRRIQIDAAGIEANLWLTGLFFILSVVTGPLSGMFMVAGIQNAFLALFNLLFINGFDGLSILGELLGEDELIEKAKRVTMRKSYKNKLLKTGIQGKASVAVSYVLSLFQLALPIIIIANIVGGAECFL